MRLRSWSIALLALLLLPAAAWGQGSLFTYSTKGAVHLRWNAPLGESYQGFHVERQLDGGDWQRITEAPLTPLYDVAQIRELLGADAESFLTFFDPGVTRISPAEFNRVTGDPFARGMIQLFSVKFPRMGRVLGELHQDRDLQPGARARYRVVILRPGESVWAQSDREVVHGSADTVPVPRELEGEGVEQSARLKWQHDAALSASGSLVSYNVYRAEAPTGPYHVASVDPVVPTRVNGAYPEFLHIDRYLENGVPYWFRITGLNVLGFESAPSASIKVIPKDGTPPPPPENFRARLHGEGAMLQWDPVSAPDLEGYRVYRSEQPDGPYEPIWPAQDEPLIPRISTIDNDVPEGAVFYYGVVAVDSSQNESRLSDRVQLFREDLTPPAQVQNLRAQAVDEGDAPGVHLTWDANGEADLRGYIVESTTRVSDGEDGVRVEDRFFAENNVPLTEARYVDPVPVDSQSRYAYRLIAVDQAWNRSEPSETVIARMPDKLPPAKPFMRHVRMAKGKVEVAWQANVEEDLVGYRVHRSVDDQNFSMLFREPVTALEHYDEGGKLQLQRVYHYRVTALDAAGNESEPSQSLSVRFRDDQAPEPPAITQVEAVDDGLRVVWGAPAKDVTGITLYRAKGQDVESVRTYLDAGAREFVDSEVEEGQQYTYLLRVVDERENLSEPGAAKSAVFEQ